MRLGVQGLSETEKERIQEELKKKTTELLFQGSDTILYTDSMCEKRIQNSKNQNKFQKEW